MVNYAILRIIERVSESLTCSVSLLRHISRKLEDADFMVENAKTDSSTPQKIPLKPGKSEQGRRSRPAFGALAAPADTQSSVRTDFLTHPISDFHLER